MLKKILLAFSMLICLATAKAQDYPPKSSMLVTDYTHTTLKMEDVVKLEQKLTAFADSDAKQIAIVIIKTTDGHPIEDYGYGLAKAWGIGQKASNDGVLVLVAITDHKVTIQTGYGATGAIPQSKAKKIIDEDLIPHFKNNDYYGGLDMATTDIMNLLSDGASNDNAQAGLAQAQQSQQDQQLQDQPAQQRSGGVSIWVIVIVVIIVLVIILIIRGRGNGGNGGQIISSRGSASPFWWFLGGSLLGGGLSNWGNGWGGGGGYGDGGSSNDNNDNDGGNDDSGGGDFGGFGGGDFGGDGASGSW